LQFDENILADVRVAIVDMSFFAMFDVAVKQGDTRALLPDDNSVVLSESATKVLFGNEEPLGQIIADNSGRQFHVTGIIADLPHNSSIRCNVVFPFAAYESTILTTNLNMGSLWRTLRGQTYFLLQPGADVSTVAQKLNDLHQRNDSWEITYSLFPFEKQNLYQFDGTAKSNLQVCRLFAVAAAVLLLIACINYVNLVTSRTSRRNKEIFVRNVFGARKRHLFAYFFSESLLMFFASLVVATALIYFLFPVYNQITGKQLDFQLFSAPTMMIYGMAFAATTLLAGIYPALKLSHGKKVSGARLGGNTFVRRTLVVLQFSASAVLILAAITITRQLHFIKTMNPGYDRDHVFYVPLSGKMGEDKEVIKTRLSQVPGIMGVTFTSGNFTNLSFGNIAIGWEGKEADVENMLISILNTDADFIPLMNVQIIEGSGFTGTSTDEQYCLVNRTAVDAMGLQDPIGKRLYVMNGKQIIGVTEDFHFQSLHEPVKPLVIAVTPWTSHIYVKAGARNIPDALNAVESVYQEYNAGLPFTYSFLDDEFDRLYKSDIRTGSLFNIFAMIAILVSCLGLFGLVTYIAETKTKEIGIRKVLGAKVSDIVTMLSKEFLILVGIAMLIAFPLSYYLLDMMLQDYAYRIGIGWWIFGLAGVITVVLTVLTIGWQAVKAATANPAKAIMNCE
jgi:ABC-type antimicrobial peptide transport system permease subunit